MPTDPISARIIATFQDKAPGALDNLLAEDVELRPPTYGKSWRGRGLWPRFSGSRPRRSIA